MHLSFSIIIPVYNRPKEVKELLESLATQNYGKPFEVILVEDGSEISAEEVAASFSTKLNIKYLSKDNSGPGDSRNFGAVHATGNYFIFFDSDCIIPPSYLKEVESHLQEYYSDAFGGMDKAHEGFSVLQKAISYSMTSLFTTGGVRGGKKNIHKFQPRSFNMGVSQKAFEKVKGFQKIHVGEDIDLTLRLWQAGFNSQLIENAFVFHKRRSSFRAFYKQMHAFGKGRAYLNRIHPTTSKITFWFPTVFMLGITLAVLLAFLNFTELLVVYSIYFAIILVDSTFKNQSLRVGFLSIFTTIYQFTGYGIGFLKAILNNLKNHVKA
jgi:glycosyltransferase involved in cell wall biosynthesis